MIHAAFEDQRQPGSHARRHIDQCPACRQYFIRTEWERKKEEERLNAPEVEALVAKYARRFQLPFWQRRKVQVAAGIVVVLVVLVFLGLLAANSLKATGASRTPVVSLLGVFGVGVDAWFGGSGSPTASATSVTPALDRRIARELTDLDRRYAEGGTPAIAKVFAEGSLLDVQLVTEWIHVRQHTSLLPLLVNALTDPRLQVRGASLFSLHKMPPLAVKTYQAALDAAAATESDPSLAIALQNFANRIRHAK